MITIDAEAAKRKSMRPDAGDQTVVRQLSDGSFFCTVNYVYKKPVSTSSEHFRNVCEARMILAMPTPEQRRSYMARAAAIRSKSARDPKAEFEKIKTGLEEAVTAEWQWRRDHREERSAA